VVQRLRAYCLIILIREKRARLFSVWLFFCAAFTGTPLAAERLVAGGNLEIDRAAYAQRLHGFWLGQSIANWTGLVTEMDRVEAPFYTDADWGTPDKPSIWGFYAAHASRIDFYLPPGDRVWGADDDTDIEYLYLHLLSEAADPLLTPTQIRDGWLRHIYANEDAPISTSEFRRENFLWVSNERAYYLMRDHKLLPPQTSEPANNPDYAMIDAQLTTEMFGLLAPGRPDVAIRLAELPIRVTASGEAAAIARFYVALHSLAITIDTDGDVGAQLRELALTARRYLPAGGYARDMLDFVHDSYRENTDKSDWERSRDALYRVYQLHGRAGYRYQQPFDAGINFAASLVSLFYGDGDIARTIAIATLAGWDSDNPAATWGGLLGFVYGRADVEGAFERESLPEHYWIHRTRRNFPDYTPGQIGEDSFSLMAARGVAVVDRVVSGYLNGVVDEDRNVWLLPSLTLPEPEPEP
jgi:hypothetical protein